MKLLIITFGSIILLAMSALPAEAQTPGGYLGSAIIRWGGDGTGAAYGYREGVFGSHPSGQLPAYLFTDYTRFNHRQFNSMYIQLSPTPVLVMTPVDLAGFVTEFRDDLRWIRVQLRLSNNNIVGRGYMWNDVTCPSGAPSGSYCISFQLLSDLAEVPTFRPTAVDFFDISEEYRSIGGGAGAIAFMGNAASGYLACTTPNSCLVGGTYPTEMITGGAPLGVGDDGVVVTNTGSNYRIALSAEGSFDAFTLPNYAVDITDIRGNRLNQDKIPLRGPSVQISGDLSRLTITLPGDIFKADRLGELNNRPFVVFFVSDVLGKSLERTPGGGGLIIQLMLMAACGVGGMWSVRQQNITIFYKAAIGFVCLWVGAVFSYAVWDQGHIFWAFVPIPLGLVCAGAGFLLNRK